MLQGVHIPHVVWGTSFLSYTLWGYLTPRYNYLHNSVIFSENLFSGKKNQEPKLGG